jgi:hypothetical protein
MEVRSKMVTKSQQHSFETNEAPQQSTGLSQKIKALKTCQAVFGKELTEDEVRQWREFLDSVPSWLVTKAFLEWAKKGKFFPKPAEILELIEASKGQNRVEFRACETNGCMDGWVRVFTGNTVGTNVTRPKPVDSKIGAVVRCKCWLEWTGR